MTRPHLTSWSDLTPAERRVVDMICDGLTNREAAAALFVSVRTIDTHVAHIFQKLGLRSRTQLVAAAFQAMAAA